MRHPSGYSDADAAALYGVLNPWGPSDAFYLQLALRAESVLDVGCGTGLLLQRARSEGHAGRLCGVDPDRAMLEVARERPDVEWVETKAKDMSFDTEFELALMNGHAFQTLVTDHDVRASLAAIRRALVPGGHLAFETRNPQARAWESWEELRLEAVDRHGNELLVRYEVESVAGDVVTLAEITGTRDGVPLRVDRGRLRFLDVTALDGFLAESGFVVEERFGAWEQEPYREESPEIVTIALAEGC